MAGDSPIIRHSSLVTLEERVIVWLSGKQEEKCAKKLARIRARMAVAQSPGLFATTRGHSRGPTPGTNRLPFARALALCRRNEFADGDA